jgi:hypothetical protein
MTQSSHVRHIDENLLRINPVGTLPRYHDAIRDQPNPDSRTYVKYPT